MVDLEIAVTCDAQTYYLTLDKTDLKIAGGKARARRKAGTYYMLWWMTGDPGNQISVSITAGTKVVGKIKDCKIPAGQSKAAGVIKFEVA